MVKLNKKGFTLAELLIVVAIIAILVAVAIPTFSNQLEKSRQAVDVSNLRGAYAAARIAQMDQQVSNASGVVNISDDDSDASTTESLTFWYDPDSGELVLDANKPSAYGKALTSTVVADTSGLHGITYSAGTNGQAIKVTFTPSDKAYVIGTIAFAAS